VSEVAEVLVSAGRVVPSLSVDADGRARSWWWPMPASAHRGLVATIVEDDSEAAQHTAADRLTEAIDAMVRARLCASKATIAPKRPGRPTVTEAWARSLVSPDPWMAASLDAEKVRTLADAVHSWVRSGSVIDGRFQLCLRVHEPPPRTARARHAGSWRIELLARDRDEPSLILPLDDIWSGRSPFGASALEDALAALGRASRLAPELSDALESASPGQITVADSAIVTVLAQRLEPLNDAGIAVLLPSWWSRRPKLGLRAKAASSPASLTDGGVGLDSIVEFTWEAALGDRRLTKADLAALTAAAETKQSLVRIRGEWVEVGSAPITDMLAAIGTAGEATAGDLLRAGLGLDDLGRGDDLEVMGVDASKVAWLDALLGDALHATVEPVPTPEAFDGVLREYQQRGVGWLGFLGRIGLGACLADDMGLGKTAQLIATVLTDPAGGPTLVVCPVSVLGNWHREVTRFAPSLEAYVHHGPGRERDPELFAAAAGHRDVVLTTYSLLARDADAFGALGWGRVVFDEAQQIKNPGAAQTKAAQAIGADRRVALTGTPVENRLSELWSIMNVLNPGLLGTASEFRDRFASPIEREHDPNATERLRRITGPFVLRRLKTDRSIITDLPDKVETVDRCPLTREQATLYRAVVDDLISDSEEAEGITRRGRVLAGLLRLKQVCNHPA
jgi:non-specific serine/threonine protein kinase